MQRAFIPWKSAVQVVERWGVPHDSDFNLSDTVKALEHLIVQLLPSSDEKNASLSLRWLIRRGSG
jgi:hypothetical protein